MCTAQSRKVIVVYIAKYREVICVLQSVGRYCVCTAQCREVIGVYTAQ